MGQVYLARATGLGGFERRVVVKTLDLSVADDEDDEAFVTMFLDQARLVGALHHQYIAPVYEVGCDDEGRYYLVMDYVHGETAELVYRASVERSWPVPLSFALTVVSCIASAFDYAHNLCSEDGTPLDIVHRDISLSNVMVGYDGAVKLIGVSGRDSDASAHVAADHVAIETLMDLVPADAERDDPTDVSNAPSASPVRHRVRTSTAEVFRPPKPAYSPWVILCVLFGAAIAVAVAIAFSH
jgi:serine/threonine protein kinase